MTNLPSFKLDDLVETKDGRQFVIAQIWKSPDGSIAYSAIGEAYHPASSLRLVPEFKKGDLVKITGPSFYGDETQIGIDFNITTIYEPCSIRNVVAYNGAEIRGLYPASSLVLVEEELKIGDWVQVVNEKSDLYGSIFQIDEITEAVGILVSEKGKPWFLPRNLRKLTPEEVQQHLAPNDIAEYRRALTKACIELNLPYNRPPIETIQEMLSMIATDREDSKYGEVLERLSTIEKSLRSLTEEHQVTRDWARQQDEIRKNRCNAIEKSLKELWERLDSCNDYIDRIAKCVGLVEKRQEEQQKKINQFDGEIDHLNGSISECLIESGDVEARAKCREKEIEKRQADQHERMNNIQMRVGNVESYQKGEMPEVCEGKPDADLIHVHIWKGNGETLRRVSINPDDCLQWAKRVLDSMREA